MREDLLTKSSKERYGAKPDLDSAKLCGATPEDTVSRLGKLSK